MRSRGVTRGVMLPGSIRIYVAAVDDHDATQLHMLERAVLALDERARGRRIIRPQSRHAHIVAHALKRLALRELLGEAPKLTRDARGKPALDGQALAFNLSHSDSHVAFVASGGAPVGVDIESLRLRVSLPHVMQAALTGQERARVASEYDQVRAFLIHWTAKEAYVKATGEGLGRPLASLALDAGGGALALSGSDVEPHELCCWSTPDYVLSACALHPHGGQFSVAHVRCTASALQAR